VLPTSGRKYPVTRVPSTMPPLGMLAPSFSLPDTEGGIVSLEDLADAPAVLVAFICNHCPFVIHIRQGFAEFGREFGDRGVAIIAINSNDVDRYPGDSPEAMALEHERAGYTFPYLFDESQDVAHAYRAACTPDLYLFDADRRLVYRGEFDGSRPGNTVPVTGASLRAAVEAVLDGRVPDPDQRPSVGCNIKWKPGNEPEWFGA